MRTCFSLKVPLCNTGSWLAELKNEFQGVEVTWTYNSHITVAFVNDNPQRHDFIKLLQNLINNTHAFSVTFDKVDAFLNMTQTETIINLTATSLPEEFTSFQETMHETLKEAGCNVTDFRFHVTLGKVNTTVMGFDSVKQRVNDIQITPFTLQLSQLEFRVLGGRTIKAWELT